MKKTILVFVIILFIKLVLQHFLINPVYDLQRDEYLHLDQGKHLAWGYISVPPMTSWVSYLINLLGNGVFWVKFFPVFFGSLTILLVWKMVEELNGKWFALALASLATLTSVLLRINILYQPNSTDIFFWTLVYFTVIKFISTENPRWLLIAGLSIGFGILSKYNIVFLLVGLLPALLLSEHRKILREGNFYLGVAIALIIVLPNILWQVNNHFPTLHQLNELSATQLVNFDRIDFIKNQFLFFINSFFIIVAAFIGLLFYKPLSKYRFFVWSYLIVIAAYIYFRAKSYYAIGLYPVLIALGSVYLEKILAFGWKRVLKPVLILLVMVLAIPFVMIAFPIRTPEQIEAHSQLYKKFGMLRWEDGKDHSLPQDFADMMGWKELAEKTDSVYNQVSEKQNTLVLCDNYGEAGAINYYSKFKNINAVTMNADYINWFALDKPIKNVILIQEASDDDPNRKREKPWFDAVGLVGGIENPYSREQGTKIYLLKGAKTNINSIVEQEIEKNKNH